MFATFVRTAQDGEELIPVIRYFLVICSASGIQMVSPIWREYFYFFSRPEHNVNPTYLFLWPLKVINQTNQIETPVTKHEFNRANLSSWFTWPRPITLEIDKSYTTRDVVNCSSRMTYFTSISMVNRCPSVPGHVGQQPWHHKNHETITALDSSELESLKHQAVSTDEMSYGTMPICSFSTKAAYMSCFQPTVMHQKLSDT